MNYDSLTFSEEYFQDFADRKFGPAERARILQAMALLDANEKHPSLRVHALAGDLQGLWSASVTDKIRIHFVRTPDGRKRCVNLSKHYAD